MMAENQNGCLWLTQMGRIVLDDHSYESFCSPGDKKILTAKELSNGIKLEEFVLRLIGHDTVQEKSE